MAAYRPSIATVRNVVRSIDFFCRRFGYALSKTTEEQEDRTNYYVTPFGVHALLAVLHQGSEGTSSTEIDNALQLQMNQIDHLVYQSILDYLLEGNQDIKVYIPTKVYLRETYLINRGLTAKTSECYSTDFETCSFANSVLTTTRINRWVERRTLSHVSDLVNASDFQDDSRMIFVSAGCFRGDWLYDFPREATREQPFEVTAEETVTVQMMSITAYFAYNCNGDLRSHIVKLPFKLQKFSMIIFLPTARDGIPHLEKELPSISMTELIESMRDTDSISVSLPRFHFESKIDFKEALSKLSISQPFNESLDFKPICDDEDPIYLSKIFQKSGISVNENGVSSCYRENTKDRRLNLPPKIQLAKSVVNANRPFLFVIVANIEACYLPVFMGRVYNPATQE